MAIKMLLGLIMFATATAQDSPQEKPTKLVGVGDMMLDGSKDFPWLNLVTDSVPNLGNNGYHSNADIISAIKALDCKDESGNQQLTLSTMNNLDVVSLKGPGDNEKTRAFYVFGIHGREYISSETALKFLTTMCDNSPRSKTILKNIEFKILPIANPIGRGKVEKGESCVDQRKNAKNVDLNRNFDIMWEQGSNLGDAEDFHGAGAFSEPESQVIRDIGDTFKPKVFVDVHSGDRTMMMPYSYITKQCASFAEMDNLLKSVNAGAFASNPVKTGAASLTLDPPYTAAGTTIDYMYEKKAIPYTYTFEIFSGVRTISNVVNAVGGHEIIRDAVIPLSVFNNQSQMDALSAQSMLETEDSLLTPKLSKTEIVSLLAEPPKPMTPVDHSAAMSLMDCFAYFNPTSKDLVDATAAQWTNALQHVAEYFIKA
jgi:hypothetical protein